MQSRDDSIRDIGKKTVKTVFSFFCSPLDSLWGIAKGAYARFKHPDDYNAMRSEYSGDKMGALIPSSTWGSRIASVLFVGLFIVALCTPIPGLTPLYLLAASTVKVLAGLAIAGTCGRTLGAGVGACVDYVKLKKVEAQTQQSHHKSKINKSWPLQVALKIGLFGESAFEANALFKAAGRFFAKLCCCFGAKKSSDDDEQAQVNHTRGSRTYSHPNSVATPSRRSSTFHTVKVMGKPKPIDLVRADSFGYVDATDPKADVGSIDASSMTPASEFGSYIPPTPDEVAGDDFTSRSTLTYSPTRSRQD
ncbi:MAG: hypothetical protein ACYCQI_01615 [Gammaproteobacteria bacterium]